MAQHTKRPVHPIRAAVLRLGAAALAAAVATAAAPAPAAARDIAVGLAAPPTSFDPHYHAASQNFALHRHVFEPLVLRNPDLTLPTARAAGARSTPADTPTRAWTP